MSTAIAAIMAILILALPVGVYLVITGLFPRPVGHTRFCRHCGYNLTGNTSGRCPECGSRLGWRRDVRFGERPRNAKRAVWGVALVLLGLGSTLPVGLNAFAHVDLYQYLPARFLVLALHSGDPRMFGHATREVCRRISAQELATADLDRAIAICLERFGRMRAEQEYSQEVIDFLERLRVQGDLTNAQAKAFYEQIIKPLRLETRPTLLLGHDCPLRIEYELHPPATWLYASVAVLAVRVDDYPVLYFDETEPAHMVPGQPQTCHSELWIQPDEPGRHAIAVDVDIALREKDPSSRAGYQRVETLETSTEVLAEERPDYIRFVRSPPIDEQVGNCVSIRQVVPALQGGYGRVDGCEVDVLFRPGLPVNVALEVYAKVHDEWYFVGIVSAPKGNTQPIHARAWTKLTPPLPYTVDLRLESSPRAAERTIDMYEVWGGTLHFDAIPTGPVSEADLPETIRYP